MNPKKTGRWLLYRERAHVFFPYPVTGYGNPVCHINSPIHQSELALCPAGYPDRCIACQKWAYRHNIRHDGVEVSVGISDPHGPPWLIEEVAA